LGRAGNASLVEAGACRRDCPLRWFERYLSLDRGSAPQQGRKLGRIGGATSKDILDRFTVLESVQTLVKQNLE